MAVSAYWHGIHPGYYLSFLTIPLCLHVEDIFYSLFVPTGVMPLGPHSECSWFIRVWFIIRMRGFEYLAMGFLLLSSEATLRYWASIGWCLHTGLIALLIVGYTLKLTGMITKPARRTEKVDQF